MVRTAERAGSTGSRIHSSNSCRGCGIFGSNHVETRVNRASHLCLVYISPPRTASPLQSTRQLLHTFDTSETTLILSRRDSSPVSIFVPALYPSRFLASQLYFESTAVHFTFGQNPSELHLPVRLHLHVCFTSFLKLTNCINAKLTSSTNPRYPTSLYSDLAFFMGASKI